MFDAKSILEGLVRGAAQNSSGRGGGGGLGDLLGQVLGGGGGSSSRNEQLDRGMGTRADQRSGGADQDGGGLADILGELQRQFGQGNGGNQQSKRNATETGSAGSASGGGGIADILGQLKEQFGKAGGAGVSGGGGIAEILSQVLTQATQGAREGASKIGTATGASDALGRATGGQSADQLLARLKELVQQNPLAAGTAAGGLGGLVLGTRTGRSIAGSAARIGALALIGGLAYKAFQNYQAGKPLITGATPAEAAPSGSGFEPAAVTNETAALYIRAMIAAAAADGRVDADEQAKVMASLQQAGAGSEAEDFIANELNSPASVQQLADAVHSAEEAVQVYTAARLAIEPDERSEQVFLASLAQALGIDDKLAAHIDATTRGAAA